MSSTLITGGKLVSALGQAPQDILVEDGIITAIGQDLGDADETIDATGKLLMPGLIDCHVHFREPGFPHKATMATEELSAREGGVVTVCDMPNTNPPTMTIEMMEDAVERAEKIKKCDIRFFFGVTEPAHLGDLITIWTSDDPAIVRLRKRCSGVKLFLENSTGNLKTPEELVEAVFKTAGELQIPLIAHCEDAALNAAATAANTSADVSAHSVMRPPESEGKSIADALELTAKHNTPFHIAHMSTTFGIDLVKQAKADGVPVTCQVCPHHLFLSTEDYATLGTHCKMNPPVRTPEHCAALWEAIADGIIDVVCTDHAPHTAEEKRTQPPLEAPSGVPGVQTMVPLLLSVVAGHWPHPTSSDCSAELSYEDIVRLCFTAPNTIFGLDKADISVGAKADIAFVTPDQQWSIHAEGLHSHCDWTPYEGWQVTGAIRAVTVE